MGKFHDDGTLEIGGFGGEETAEESPVFSDVGVLKKEYERLEREFKKLTNYVRAIDRNESQLRDRLMFISRCFIVTNAALIVSIIGLLVYAIVSN